jgi:hypothetical protein
MVMHMTTPTVHRPPEARLNHDRCWCIICSHLPGNAGPTWPAVQITLTADGMPVVWSYCLDHIDSVDAGVEMILTSADLTLVRVDDHRTPDERLTFVDGVGTVLLPSLNRVAVTS